MRCKERVEKVFQKLPSQNQDELMCVKEARGLLQDFGLTPKTKLTKKVPYC